MNTRTTTKAFLQTIGIFLLAVSFGVMFSPSVSFGASETVEVNLEIEQGNNNRDSGSRSSRAASLVLRVNDITTSQDSISISWETTVRSKSTVRWSRADDEGQSQVQSSDADRRSHTTELTGLKSGTRYEVELTADAVTGDTETRREIIRTNLPDGPESPANLQASLTADRNVQLSWQNPPSGQFDYLRVTRSDTFFAGDPLEGQLVFEGSDMTTVDRQAEPGDTYFYSLYARNESGVWSAPSLAAIYVPADTTASVDTTSVDDAIQNRPDAPQSTQDLLADFSFSDLIFSQNQNVRQKIPDQDLVAGQPFSVGLDYEEMPEVLKTVLITMKDPQNSEQTFSFVLRADEAKNFYRATIGGLKKSGMYDVEATVLDYKNRRVKSVTGQLQITQPTSTKDQIQVSPVMSRITDLSNTADVSGFILMLLTLFGLASLIIRYQHQ